MAVKYRSIKPRIQLKDHTAWMLYFYSMPALFAVFSHLLKGQFFSFLMSGATFLGLLIGAVWMTKGRRNRYVFEQREYGLDVPFPLMMLASLVMGGSCFTGAYFVTDLGLLAALGFAVAATVGCWLWYGVDATNGKSGYFEALESEAKKILNTSENRVLQIEESAQTIENTELSQRLEKITQLSRDVLKVLVDNPEKLPKARRFLYSYLEGTESVIERYAATHRKTDNQALEENFRQVLENIEKVFAEQYDKLVSSDVFDLDVDIEVLNTLLEKQGIN